MRHPNGSSRSSPSEPEHSWAGRLRFYLVLASMTTLGPFSLDMYLPGLPALGKELHASESAAQLTLTACLIGLGVGQLLGGPLSDAVGRRMPTVAAIVTYAVASVLCAVAPSLPLLLASRFIQGVAGGAVGVVATAVVRDRYAGRAAAQFFALLLLVTLLSPLFAPVFGGALLVVTSWRGVFVALAVIGVTLLLVALLGLPETLPSERRRRGGFRDAALTLGRLSTDRSFIGYALPAALAGGAIFTYLAGSAFVLEQIYGTSPQIYGLLFALNGIALGVSSQVNRWLLNRLSSERLFAIGLVGLAAGGLTLILGVAFGVAGAVVIVAPVMLIIASNGFIGPNSASLALTPHPDAAGSGAALLGSLRFTVGGVVAPLVGTLGSKTALPLAIIMCCLCVAAPLAALVGRPAFKTSIPTRTA